MMITKEECLEAYEKLKYDHYLITEDDDGNLIHINNLYKNELNLFKHLINEHFDNPPLKFEDLKVGMWVWDNEILQELVDKATSKKPLGISLTHEGKVGNCPHCNKFVREIDTNICECGQKLDWSDCEL